AEEEEDGERRRWLGEQRETQEGPAVAPGMDRSCGEDEEPEGPEGHPAVEEDGADRPRERERCPGPVGALRPGVQPLQLDDGEGEARHRGGGPHPGTEAAGDEREEGEQHRHRWGVLEGHRPVLGAVERGAGEPALPRGAEDGEVDAPPGIEGEQHSKDVERRHHREPDPLTGDAEPAHARLRGARAGASFARVPDSTARSGASTLSRRSSTVRRPMAATSCRSSPSRTARPWSRAWTPRRVKRTRRARPSSGSGTRSTTPMDSRSSTSCPTACLLTPTRAARSTSRVPSRSRWGSSAV